MVRQEVVLEHSTAEDTGVLGLVSRPDTSNFFILDCDRALVSLDTRQRRADTLVSLPITAEGVTPASLNMEPTSKQLVSVCRDNMVMIWDLRKTTSPVWSEGLVSRWAEVTFAGWSGTGAEFCVVQDGGHLVFDVSAGGVPSSQPRVSFFSQGYQANEIWVSGAGKHYRKPASALRGDIWCRWSPILFNVKFGNMEQKTPEAVGSNQYNCTWLTATNSTRYSLCYFEVCLYLCCNVYISGVVKGVLVDKKFDTKRGGEMVVHCHRSRPQLVLANSDGDGRLKTVSATPAADQAS